MKHAGPDALDQLEGLLAEIRGFAGIKEKGRGVFYRKSKAFLHFHEDPTGLYADVRVADGWRRYRVAEAGEREAFVRALAETI